MLIVWGMLSIRIGCNCHSGTTFVPGFVAFGPFRGPAVPVCAVSTNAVGTGASSAAGDAVKLMPSLVNSSDVAVESTSIPACVWYHQNQKTNVFRTEEMMLALRQRIGFAPKAPVAPCAMPVQASNTCTENGTLLSVRVFQ
jgi:hypothetical protein